MTEQTLRQRLDATHQEYDQHYARWIVAQDLWNGTGGVAPPCDQLIIDDSQKGDTPNPLPGWKGRTYLDRYPRESFAHFKARIRAAFYENYLADIGDTIVGFLQRRPPEFPDLSPALKSWWAAADVTGKPMLDVAWSLLTTGLQSGLAPSLVDRRRVTAASRAEAEALGLRTYVLPYLPQVMTNWSRRADGAYAWVIFKDLDLRQGGPLDPAVTVTRWTVWTETEWMRYEAVGSDEPAQVAGDRHPCRRVPLAVFNPSEPALGCTTSRTPLWGTVECCRAIYNRVSEKVDIMRGFGSPLLLWPVAKGTNIKAIKAGTDAAVPCSDTGNMPTFLTLQASALEGYSEEIDRLISAAYRQARADFQKEVAESGYSRAQRFQQKNSQLVQTMGLVVKTVQELAFLFLLWEGLTDEDARAEAATAKPMVADDYDLRDLARELEAAEAAMRLRLGPTAEAEIKKQVRSGLITLRGKKLADSDAEIDAEAAANKPPAGSQAPAGQAGLDNPAIPDDLAAAIEAAGPNDAAQEGARAGG